MASGMEAGPKCATEKSLPGPRGIPLILCELSEWWR